jgi:hypothetical protein
MSYRLLHCSGEFRWILERGAPHWAADGQFLGFFGGCAETPAEVAVKRIAELRGALNEMRVFAERIAAVEATVLRDHSIPLEIPGDEAERVRFDHLARTNAAKQLGQLAADMLTYDRIPNGARMQ